MSRSSLVARLLVLLVASLCIAGCAARVAAIPETLPDRGVCRNGAGETNRQAPIVCVDDSQRTLSVRPDPVHAHDVLASDRKTPVRVQWFTNSGRGDLEVDVKGTCVGRMHCIPGQGHCWAETIPGTQQQCKYDVSITSGDYELLDPTLAVGSCCS